MKANVQFKVGQTVYSIEIDERDEMDTLHKMAVIGNPPGYCHECKNNDISWLRLDSNKDKEGNVYVNIVCKKCGAKAKLGLYKAGGYFWHKFKKYVKEGSEDKTVSMPQQYPETLNDTVSGQLDSEIPPDANPEAPPF